MTAVTPRLARPDLAPLVDELVRRFGTGEVPVTVALHSLPDPARRALADLFGTDRVPGPRSRVRVDRLIEALDLASVEELRAAVETLRGPLANRRDDRRADQAAKDALWGWLAQRAATITLGRDPSGLMTWVDGQRSAGIRGGIEIHRRRLESAVHVLDALPADGRALASLASDRAGDPHALDHGRALAGIVLDAVAAVRNVARPADAEGIRHLWESVGVVPDPLSSTVLALGLPGGTDEPLGRWLADAASVSEPVVLSLANLRRWPRPALAATSKAFVVENPSLVAEAAAAGWSGPPLICSSGRPTVAVVTLVRQLGAAGAAVFQHADFDPAGLAITAWLAERAATTPWQMSRAAYLDTVDTVDTVDRVDAVDTVRRSQQRRTIDGPVPATPWDPPLEEAVRSKRVAVYEEEIRARLLGAMA
jgi:uncharacterized protein (TIGR02679 family)